MSIVRIAEYAGVSTATVSRVLNDFPGVSPSTASQVRAAAEALKYVAPLVKRGPKLGNRRITRIDRSVRRTNTLAVLTIGQNSDWLQMPVMASALSGVTDEAKNRNYRLLLGQAVDVKRQVSALNPEEIDGAIVFMSGYLTKMACEWALHSLGNRVPLVRAMGCEFGPAMIDHVTADNQAASYLALEYLQQRCCKTVAFLTEHPFWSIMRHRGQAFLNAAADANMSATALLVTDDPETMKMFGPGVVAEETIEQLVDRMLLMQPRPDGLFVGNDATTVKVHAALSRRGIRPDKDIALVSCDNEQLRLSALEPRPASIDIGAEEVGRRAVRRLHSRLNHPAETPFVIHVAPRLVLPDNGIAGATLTRTNQPMPFPPGDLRELYRTR